jgi:hypothetical protein
VADWQSSRLGQPEKIPWPPAGHENKRRSFRAVRFHAGVVFVSGPFPVCPERFRVRFQFLRFVSIFVSVRFPFPA